MPYDTIIVENEYYIRAEVSGVRRKGKEEDDAKIFWSQVISRCKKTGIYKLLVISRISGALPPVSAFSLASNPEEFGFNREFQLALVDLNEESRENNLFAETVAVNRGWLMKVFDNEQEATKWLFPTH